MSANPVGRLVVKIVMFVITANIFVNRVFVQLQRYVGKHVLFLCRHYSHLTKTEYKIGGLDCGETWYGLLSYNTAV
jgi:hypothetical protein